MRKVIEFVFPSKKRKRLLKEKSEKDFEEYTDKINAFLEGSQIKLTDIPIIANELSQRVITLQANKDIWVPLHRVEDIKSKLRKTFLSLLISEMVGIVGQVIEKQQIQHHPLGSTLMLAYLEEVQKEEHLDIEEGVISFLEIMRTINALKKTPSKVSEIWHILRDSLIGDDFLKLVYADHVNERLLNDTGLTKKEFTEFSLEYIYYHSSFFEYVRHILMLTKTVYSRVLEKMRYSSEMRSRKMRDRLSIEIRNKIEELQQSIEMQSLKFNNAFKLKKEFISYAAEIKHAFHILSHYLKEDFAAHGSSAYPWDIFKKGLRSGGQGGLNVVINQVGSTFGNIAPPKDPKQLLEGDPFRAFYIFRISDLIENAVKLNAYIEIQTPSNNILSFKNGKFHYRTHSQPNDVEAFLARKKNFNWENFLKEKEHAVLRIERGEEYHIVVPAICVTVHFPWVTSEMKKRGMQNKIPLVFDASHFIPRYGNEANEASSLYLMRSSEGKNYLNKVLNKYK